MFLWPNPNHLQTFRCLRLVYVSSVQRHHPFFENHIEENNNNKSIISKIRNHGQKHTKNTTFSTASLLFSNCCRARLIGLILVSTATVRFTVISFGYFERSFAANASVTGLVFFLSCASSSLPDADYREKKE